MNTATVYRYNLDRSSKKYTCPGCKQKRLVRVVDTETAELLPEHVGRCDRENGCGYNYTWNQYLKEQGNALAPFIDVKTVEVKPIEFIPLKYLTRSLSHYQCNNLYLFLETLFTERVAVDLCKRYLIGTSKLWKGATVYPQIDEEGRLRQLKIMLYNPETGKRVKAGETVERYDKKQSRYLTEVTEDACSKIYGKFLGEDTKGLNLEQTFFGHHLLREYPAKDVCIVESEKTALICSVYMPSAVWLATGGASGCRWKEYAVYNALRDRKVIFFPDYGYFNKKTGKTCYQEWSERVERIKEVLPCRMLVSDVLEKGLAHLERRDEDFADLLLKRDTPTGLAVTSNGYPVSWDYSEGRLEALHQTLKELFPEYQY
jgi:hypothetical protein